MTTLTKKQLMKFIKVRNASHYHTNLQFQFDADACGFKVSDLGVPVKVGEGDYQWKTAFGTLREYRGVLSLE